MYIIFHERAIDISSLRTLLKFKFRRFQPQYSLHKRSL